MLYQVYQKLPVDLSDEHAPLGPGRSHGHGVTDPERIDDEVPSGIALGGDDTPGHPLPLGGEAEVAWGEMDLDVERIFPPGPSVLGRSNRDDGRHHQQQNQQQGLGF